MCKHGPHAFFFSAAPLPLLVALVGGLDGERADAVLVAVLALVVGGALDSEGSVRGVWTATFSGRHEGADWRNHQWCRVHRHGQGEG